MRKWIAAVLLVVAGFGAGNFVMAEAKPTVTAYALNDGNCQFMAQAGDPKVYAVCGSTARWVRSTANMQELVNQRLVYSMEIKSKPSGYFFVYDIYVLP